MSYNRSKAFLGRQAVVGYAEEGGDGTEEGAYTAVAEILSFTSPKAERGKVKTTNNETPDDTHEYIPGYSEPGDTEMECHMTDADFCTLDGFRQAGTILSWKTIYDNAISSSGTVIVVSGFVASVVAEYKGPDSLVTHKLKITHTGKQTVTPAN